MFRLVSMLDACYSHEFARCRGKREYYRDCETEIIEYIVVEFGLVHV